MHASDKRETKRNKSDNKTPKKKKLINLAFSDKNKHPNKAFNTKNVKRV